MDEEIISMHDIFLFNQTGVDQHGDAEGYYMSTGMRPLCTERLEASSIHLPTEMFERHVLKT
jgi:pilus assembly protein CpaF